MTESDTQPVEYPQWAFFRFGLIVTGETEQQHLQKLFKSLEQSGTCNFRVIRRIDQLGAITSAERLKGLRNGKNLPSKDERIGLAIRHHLTREAYDFVLLIDDLEHSRRNQAQEIFDRYRTALDTVLDTLKHRASVHFLVYMLEAYYFADAEAINAILKTSLSDYEGDVEDIHDPKEDLKRLPSGFREINDGGEILDQIDIEHVLSRPDACASLRTLFAWCVKALAKYSNYDYADLDDKYRLHDGILSVVTGTQLDNF
jgi:hypothetical protein